MKFDKKRLGKCYQLAGNYVVGRSDSTLVHGTIQNFGHPPNPHAWVVFKDKKDGVWEPVTDRIWTPEGFTSFFNPVPLHSYPSREAAEKMLETGNFGPWE